MRISEWPEYERPRERLLKHGAAALSESELLAIFLRTGSAGKNAVELGRDLVARFGSLHRLFAATLEEFAAIEGFGPAKYAQLKAVTEIARRALAEELSERDNLSSPRAVRDFLQLTLGGRGHEVFVALFLDAQNRLLLNVRMHAVGIETVAVGSSTHSSVRVCEIFSPAVAVRASALVLAHNHPSGVAEPSRADELLTQTLKQALSLVEIKTLDHFIVAGTRIVSFAERGLL